QILLLISPPNHESPRLFRVYMETGISQNDYAHFWHLNSSTSLLMLLSQLIIYHAYLHWYQLKQTLLIRKLLLNLRLLPSLLHAYLVRYLLTLALFRIYASIPDGQILVMFVTSLAW